MVQWGFVIDNRVCIGCHACTVACKAEHLVPIGVNRTWVKYIEKGHFPNVSRSFQVSRCNHCRDAPCVSICPTTSLFTRDDGIVDFDNRRCIGCKSCTQACPYDAIYIDPSTDTAAKCNFCAHRIDQGLNPSCVNICPEQAIRFGDMNDPSSDVSKLISREGATVRKAEKGTMPGLYYIDGDASNMVPGATNPTHETMWSSQDRGVGHFAGVDGNATDLLDLLRKVQVTQTAGTGEVLAGASTLGGMGAPAHPADKAALIRELERATTETNARRAYDQPDKGLMWGWEVSAYIFTKAVAAGVAFVAAMSVITNVPDSAMFSSSPWAPLAALVFLGLTGGLLVKDLDQPKRFLYVLLRPQWKSWLVKGAYIITAFGGLLTLWLVCTLLLGSSAMQTAMAILAWPLLLLSVAAAGYTGLLFGQCKGRDFWQSPALTLHMIIHAPLAGFSVLGLLGYTGQWTVSGLLASVVASGLVIGIEIWGKHPTADAAAVAKDIQRGKAGRYFWWGVLAAGHGLPLLVCAVLLASNVGGLGHLLMALASIGALVGFALATYLWVHLPQKRPNV